MQHQQLPGPDKEPRYNYRDSRGSGSRAIPTPRSLCRITVTPEMKGGGIQRRPNQSGHSGSTRPHPETEAGIILAWKSVHCGNPMKMKMNDGGVAFDAHLT